MQDDPTEDSPSQAALSAQQAQQAAYSEAERRGRLTFAASEVLDRQREGGNPEEAKALLGQLDALAQYPGDEEVAKETYEQYKRYVRGGGVRAQHATSPSAPPGTQPAQKPTQPPRPQTAAQKRSDEAAMLDPKTPIATIKEIQARRAEEG